MGLFEEERPDVVIHLAAQAGVRYSIENPRAYLESNINGTFELLEAARAFPPVHMHPHLPHLPTVQMRKCPTKKRRKQTIRYLLRGN